MRQAQVNIDYMEGLSQQGVHENLAYALKELGFLDAKSSVETTKDDAAHTVSYTFNVVPGEVFRMRDVLMSRGLTDDQKTQLTRAWKLPMGAVYERAVAESAVLSLKTICNGHPAQENLLPDHPTHPVDIPLSCK